MESRLPLDKLRHLKLLVAEWHLCKICLRKELEFLVGHLSHGCKVFKPEKRFLQGLIGRSLAGPKRHHFISISTLSSEQTWSGGTFSWFMEWHLLIVAGTLAISRCYYLEWCIRLVGLCSSLGEPVVSGKGGGSRQRRWFQYWWQHWYGADSGSVPLFCATVIMKRWWQYCNQDKRRTRNWPICWDVYSILRRSSNSP